MLHLMIYTTPSRMGNMLEHRKLAFWVLNYLLIHGVPRTLKTFTVTGGIQENGKFC